MQLAAKYKRPAIVARLNNEGFVRGSIRGLGDSELKDFKAFLTKSGLFEYCEGHANAAGCSILNSRLSSFHSYANEQLKDMDFNENVYDVNFILHSGDNISEIIYELEEIKDTYGQNNNEPLIVVESIPINLKQQVAIYDEKDTVKISYKEVSYLFFKARDLIEYIKNSTENIVDFTILGRGSLNDYRGNVTPQIIVEDYDIKKTSRFDF